MTLAAMILISGEKKLNNTFVPYGDYADIINLLGKWKILDLKNIKSKLESCIEYPNLTKKVRKLERAGVVKSIYIGKRNKHIYLTNKGIEMTPFDSTFEISKENLNHDLTVSNFLNRLLEFENFYDGKMFHQLTEDDLLPDAMVKGIRAKSKYNMAIEIELTQKSKERVSEKLRRYKSNQAFHYVLYATPKDSLYRSYQKTIKKLDREIQEKVILMHDPILCAHKSAIGSSKCFYLEEVYKFPELFKITGI